MFDFHFPKAATGDRQQGVDTGSRVVIGNGQLLGLEGATTNGKLMVQLHEVPGELRGRLPKQGLQESDAHKAAAKFIATRDLTGIDSSGREFSIRLGIGAPYRIDGGDWACPMAIEGLHSLKRDGIVGVDAFQALMLAQRLAKQLLESHIQKGGQILDGSGDALPVAPVVIPSPRASALSARPRSANRATIIVVSLIGLVIVGFAIERLWLSERRSAANVAPAPATSTPPAAATAPDIPERSVAVLPFVDMSEKHDQEYFADGLAEELLDRLARIPGLHVPARTSSFYFKGKPIPISQIAHDRNRPAITS